MARLALNTSLGDPRYGGRQPAHPFAAAPIAIYAQMHEDLQKLLQQYAEGRITRLECVTKIRDNFDDSFGAEDVPSVSVALPAEVRDAIEQDVNTAPRTTEEWARFRMLRGVGVFNERIPEVDVERAFAEEQARYYRFVIAWRGVFDKE